MAAAMLAAAILLVGCEKKQQNSASSIHSENSSADATGASQKPKSTPIPIETSTPVIKDEELEKRLAHKWGIKVHSLRLTSGGYMLDFRFRVLDPVKAKPLLGRGVPVYLEHPESGLKFFVPSTPKAGSLRSTTLEPIKDRIYFALFANPGAYLTSGGKVNIAIADMKAEGLIIQ